MGQAHRRRERQDDRRDCSMLEPQHVSWLEPRKTERAKPKNGKRVPSLSSARQMVSRYDRAQRGTPICGFGRRRVPRWFVTRASCSLLRGPARCSREDRDDDLNITQIDDDRSTCAITFRLQLSACRLREPRLETTCRPSPASDLRGTPCRGPAGCPGR